jgi:hypothetical protein
MSIKVQRVWTSAVLLAVVSGSAFGQRGIMGGRGALTPGRGAGSLARDGGVQVPKYVNAVNLLIEHRQELSLSDSQFVRLIAAKRTLDSTNVPLLRKLDSVQRVFRSGVPMFSAPSTQRRDSLAEARALVNETLGTVRQNIAAARDKAYAILSTTQLTKAQELEEKAEKAAAADNERNERSAGRGGDGSKQRPPD